MPLGELAQTLIPRSLHRSPVCITLIMPDGEIFQKLKQYPTKMHQLKKYNNTTLFCVASFVLAMNLKNVLQMLVQIINAQWAQEGEAGKQTRVSPRGTGTALLFLSHEFPQISGAGPGLSIHHKA